jgi:hypothetical protein
MESNQILAVVFVAVTIVGVVFFGTNGPERIKNKLNKK